MVANLPQSYVKRPLFPCYDLFSGETIGHGEFAEFRIETHALIDAMNGRKIACYRIENIGFKNDLIAIRNMLFFEPEVLQNGRNCEARINI